MMEETRALSLLHMGLGTLLLALSQRPCLLIDNELVRMLYCKGIFKFVALI